MDNNKKTFTYILGRAVGSVLALCTGLCIAAVTVAITIKIFMWLF